MDSQHRRELTDNQKKSLLIKYQEHLQHSRGGFLTTNKRKRLLGTKRGDEGTPDADFWYKLKQSARDSIVDLQMICDVANRDQIKEIFQFIPITESVKKGKTVDPESLVSIDGLIWSVLLVKKSKNDDDVWKALLVKDIMEKCLNYIMLSGILMTKSHQRLIEEMRDLMDAIVSVSVQVPIEKRDAVQF